MRQFGADLGVLAGVFAGWLIFGSSGESAGTFVSLAISLMIGLRLVTAKLDGIDAAIFVLSLVGGIAFAITAKLDMREGAGWAAVVAIGGLFIGHRMRRGGTPDEDEELDAGPAHAESRKRGTRKGRADVVRISLTRTLRMLLIGVGALIALAGAIWTYGIAQLTRDAGSQDVEYWIPALGTLAAGVTAAAWGIWLGTRTPRSELAEPTARKRQKARRKKPKRHSAR